MWTKRSRMSSQLSRSSTSSNRQAVHREHEIDRVLRPRIEADLLSDHEAVQVVELDSLGRHAVGGPEEAELNPFPVVVDTAAQDVDGAAGVELLRQPAEEALLDVVAVHRDEPLPFLGLARPNESKQVGGVEGQLAVPELGVAGDPTVVDEVIGDEVLEGLLAMDAHQAPPGMGIAPLTAAVIRECRLSWSSFS